MRKTISREYFIKYQLKIPPEISKIIGISDPIYTFSEVLKSYRPEEVFFEGRTQENRSTGVDKREITACGPICFCGKQIRFCPANRKVMQNRYTLSVTLRWNFRAELYDDK